MANGFGHLPGFCALQSALKRLYSRVIDDADDVIWQAVPNFNSTMDKLLSVEWVLDLGSSSV